MILGFGEGSTEYGAKEKYQAKDIRYSKNPFQ